MKENEYKPGEVAQKDLTLNVVDSEGKNLGQIEVPKGHTIPPTREKGGEKYEKE